MSDHEELIEGKARPDVSHVEAQDEGLEEVGNERGREGGGHPKERERSPAPESAQHVRTVVEGTCGMGINDSARGTLEYEELRVMRASPYNLRWN